MIKKALSGGSIAVGVVSAWVAGAGFVLWRGLHPEAAELTLVPAPARSAAVAPPGSTEIGVGSGQDADGGIGARKALREALERQHRRPDTVITFATSPTALAGAVAEVRSELGPRVRVYGGTSDAKGVLTDRGLVGEGQRGPAVVALMTITSDDIVLGAGGAPFGGHRSAMDAAKAAATEAVRSAGRNLAERPRAVLIASSGANV